ncbi:MAG: (2Fe-2S)-binding protein [Desulfurococcales archaeon]|nr:(2Fe-2S)-binding protein [Desulfurococcales archaeon]
MGGEVRKHPTIICRCNDVTVEDVERAIEEGYTDLESLRKRLRIGMGPCQGRTCIPLLIRILARKLGKKPAEIMLPVTRPPIVPVPLELFLKSKDAAGGEEK